MKKFIEVQNEKSDVSIKAPSKSIKALMIFIVLHAYIFMTWTPGFQSNATIVWTWGYAA